MDVTFFNTFHGYCLLYTYLRLETYTTLPTLLHKYSYEFHIILPFLLFLHAFTLCENISGSASIFASTDEFLALYPYVKIRFTSLTKPIRYPCKPTIGVFRKCLSKIRPLKTLVIFLLLFAI